MDLVFLGLGIIQRVIVYFTPDATVFLLQDYVVARLGKFENLFQAACFDALKGPGARLLNPSLPFGPTTVKFCVSNTLFYYPYWSFSRRTASFAPCPLGNWVGKVVSPTTRPTYPGRRDVASVDPCLGEMDLLFGIPVVKHMHMEWENKFRRKFLKDPFKL